jgi:hypothetical protein
MTLTFQASNDGHAVSTFFKRPHDMNHIHFSGAWNPYDLDVYRILQSHRTCQVRRRVPSEIAAKCNNNRFKIFTHGIPLKKLPKVI